MPIRPDIQKKLELIRQRAHAQWGEQGWNKLTPRDRNLWCYREAVHLLYDQDTLTAEFARDLIRTFVEQGTEDEDLPQGP